MKFDLSDNDTFYYLNSVDQLLRDTLYRYISSLLLIFHLTINFEFRWSYLFWKQPRSFYIYFRPAWKGVFFSSILPSRSGSSKT